MLLHAVVAAMIAVASPRDACAQLPQRYLLIDDDLRADTVDLVAIENGQVECLRSGLIDRRPMGDLLVMMRLDEEDGSSRFDAGDRFVELADGQRWIGAPARSPLPEHLGWKIDRIGVLAAPLDKVLRARLRAEAPLPTFDENAEGDRLRLSNGDALSACWFRSATMSRSKSPVRVWRRAFRWRRWRRWPWPIRG